MKKYISFLLACLMLSSALLSCAEENNSGSGQTDTLNTASQVVAEEETESLTPHWDAVSKTSLGGMDIRATTNTLDANFFNILDVEEMTGEALSDEIYTRNRQIESTLDCTFSVVYGDGAAVLEESVRSGSGDVHFAYNLLSTGGTLIQKNYLLPFNSLENIDMTQPYWDQGAQKNLKILGNMYFGFMDFGFDHYDSLAVLFYNGKLLDNYQLEDPQELVLSGEWTIDKMSSQLSAVLTDTNGDGKYTMGTDVLGLTGREYWFQPLLNISGESLASWDDHENKFVLNMSNDRFVRVSEAISTIYSNQNPATDYSDYDKGRIAFSNGLSLYYSRLLGDFRRLREVEDDFGVVCFPRYDDGTNSESAYFVKNPTTLYLPVVVSDTNGDGTQDYNEIGIFLEAMGAYTHDISLNLYLETAVIGKGMRDQKSADMVRLMMQNRTFDICEAFSLHSIMDAYRKCIIENQGLASSAAKTASQFEKLTSKLVDAILAFNNEN